MRSLSTIPGGAMAAARASLGRLMPMDGQDRERRPLPGAAVQHNRRNGRKVPNVGRSTGRDDRPATVLLDEHGFAEAALGCYGSALYAGRLRSTRRQRLKPVGLKSWRRQTFGAVTHAEVGRQ